jgi:hypothetical protein
MSMHDILQVSYEPGVRTELYGLRRGEGLTKYHD